MEVLALWVAKVLVAGDVAVAAVIPVVVVAVRIVMGHARALVVMDVLRLFLDTLVIN